MAPKRRSSVESGAYDAHYFDCELHRYHWFTNNAAKDARRWSEVLRMLEPRASDRLLEIGCGAGRHAIALAQFVGHVIGIDRSLVGVQRAGAFACRAGTPNIAFATCDAATLPFADGTFQKVAAIDFAEHVDDANFAKVLAEVHRVLDLDGILAIFTPCVTHYVERLKSGGVLLRQIPEHIAVRGPEAYRKLLGAAGFGIRSCRFLPSDYPLFGAVDRLLARVPGIGPWFRFRICIAAVRLAA